MNQKNISSHKDTPHYKSEHLHKNNNRYQNLQTMVIEKGTKRIRVRMQPITKKNTQTDRVQKIVCNACNHEIKSEVCKVVVMCDRDNNPQVFHYHFFFPCWDFEMLCKRYTNLTLEKVGVSIPENILMTENATRDLNNVDFWK